MALTEPQKKFLRGRGHALKPLIMVGDAGLSESVMAEFESTIQHHELIKVRVKVGDRDARAEVIETLCQQSGAELVQRVGNMALVYRENSEKKNKLLLPNR